jgi:hypothetical protein
MNNAFTQFHSQILKHFLYALDSLRIEEIFIKYMLNSQYQLHSHLFAPTCAAPSSAAPLCGRNQLYSHPIGVATTRSRRTQL